MRRFILFYLLTVSALFIYGDHPETLYKKGQEALKSHRYEEAISLFTLAIRNYRESSGICLHCLYRDRGRANCNLNRSNLALSDLTRALELDPENRTLNRWRGTVR